MSKSFHPRIGVIGSINMDIVVDSERLPEQGETILGKNVHFIPGGKGANQAVAAARLGADTKMIGALGKDEFGKSLFASLKKEKIDVTGVKQIADVHSGIASILLTKNDNRIIVVPGANHQLLPEHLLEYESLIHQADIILLQLEIPIETVELAIQLAKKANKKVVLNPAPASQISEEAMKQVDYITPNRSELAYFTDQKIENERDLEAGMRLLIEQGPQHVVTTLGSQGAAYMGPDRKLQLMKGHSVSVVDTTGAGDSFNAAFAYAIAKGEKVPAAVSFAIKASALKVTKLGAQTGMPYLEEVEQFQEE